MNLFITYNEIASLIEKKTSVRPTFKFIDARRVEVNLKPAKLLPEITMQMYINAVTRNLIGMTYDCNAVVNMAIKTAVRLFESKLPKWICIMADFKKIIIEPLKIKELQNKCGDETLFDIECNEEGVTAMFAAESQLLHIKANAGDVDAQFYLAECYRYGTDGVEQDCKLAVKWYCAAAEQGNADAQCNLGYCYEKGIGVEKDEEEAFDWYRLSAGQGNAVAQHNLAVCYENGIGVEQDEEEAVEWYIAAAEQGYVDAQYNLALCYENGIGVERDEEEAVEWYIAAAEQGYVNAQYNLALCYENGIGVERDEEEAVEWYIAAAEQGYVNAQYNLALCYENGIGVEQDDKEAIEWYRAAAEQGDDDAAKRLAELDNEV